MKYKIIVDKQSRTNPSDEKREYEIDIEELRCKGDVYDSLIITKDEDYIMRRLSLSDLHVLSVLDEPVKEPLQDINIELFEGDNYIYLLDMVGNKFYAEYLVKNDFNDIYVTRREVIGAIELSQGQIELSVNQKLDNELTGANIILKINNTESEAKINADKIELSANDVLNLLAGNEINLTSKGITISSDKFNVGENGKVRIISDAIDVENAEFKVIGDKLTTNIYSCGIITRKTGGGVIPEAGFEISGDDGSETARLVLISTNGDDIQMTAGQGIDCEGYMHASGTVTGSNISSDRRLKKNIKNSKAKAIDIIKQIKHREFNWKKDDKHINIGYIAQELEKIDKNFVIKKDDMYYVDFLPILATVTKAIQEQQELIEQLQESDKQKDKQIKELTKRLEKLEVAVNGED